MQSKFFRFLDVCILLWDVQLCAMFYIIDDRFFFEIYAFYVCLRCDLVCVCHHLFYYGIIVMYVFVLPIRFVRHWMPAVGRFCRRISENGVQHVGTYGHIKSKMYIVHQ